MSDISVIIPTYNRADRLRRAIESVLSQSLLPAEIIVVDDGSTDHSAELVAQIGRSSSTPIGYFQQPNRGPAAARNHGLRKACSCYIAFLDSDDQWQGDKLAVQYQALRSRPEFLISHTAERWYRNDEHLNQKKYHLPSHGMIFKQSLRLCCVGMSTVMAHRNLFRRVGLFDETLRCCEDYDLWLRVSAFEPFLLVDRRLTIKHGGRPDQVSTIFRVGMDRFRIQALARLIHTAALSRSQLSDACRELQRRCRIYGAGCMKHDKEDEAAYYFQLAQYTEQQVFVMHRGSDKR